MRYSRHVVGRLAYNTPHRLHLVQARAQCLAWVALLVAFLPQEAATQGQDVADEVFYQIMPIAWRDSNSDTYRFGDFGGLTASLDYLTSLGVTAVWLNPIFPSPAYHGYQHGRADELNAWFGTQSDLVAFLEAAHARGIKVFVDFVAYGISHDSPWFQSAHGNPASPYDSWLAFTNADNTQYLGSQYTTWNGSTVGFIHWDLRDPGPVNLVTTWAQFWLDPNGDSNFTDGLDGYRLDHVWQTYPSGPEGYGYHIDTFWAPWRDALRSVNPDVFCFAEQADWGSHGAELLAGLDAAFTKPFEFAARDALASERASSLYTEMASTLVSLLGAASGTYLCTIGNHDVDRLATAIGDDLNKGKAAAAVLLTQPFPPVIYYGDEIGMRGAKNSGLGSDASDIPMREPFKWNAVAGPPMSNYFALHPAAFASRQSQDNDGRSVAEQLGMSGSLLETYRDLIVVRRGSIALRRGDYTAVNSSSSRVWSFVRHHPDQQVIVAINLRGSTVSTTLDLSAFEIPGGSTAAVDLLTGNSYPELRDTNKAAYPLSLPRYGTVILEVDLVPPAPPVNLADGRNIPADFPPFALQTTQNNATGLGDNISELNQLFVRASGDSVFFGVTGNLALDGTGLALLLDTHAGGQNVLDLSGHSPPPSGPEQLTGLALDTGFVPDQLLFINAFGGSVYVDQFELLTGGGTVKTYRGQGAVNSGSGILVGGNNPNGMQVALDNTNTAGVTEVDASGAPTATTGFDIYSTRADLGLDAQALELRIAAFLMQTNGDVSNQWLPGLGGGYPNLGQTPDMNGIPGTQYVAANLDTQQVDVGSGDYDGLELLVSTIAIGRAPTDFVLQLPVAGRAQLAIYDARGRLVVRLLDERLDAGEKHVSWDGKTEAGAATPSGIYFARLVALDQIRSQRFVIVR